ncbi:MAG: hypothetical protein JJ975_08430 [Bacteroidia bacterium]|nr:hypothetical protein [Bacteroidia bacterium]
MRKIGEISAIILLLSLSRLAISIPNMEPIGAAALFGGALLSSRYLKFIIPILALFVGDLIIAMLAPSYSAHLFSVTFVAVYISFLITVLIGKRMIGAKPKMKNIIGAGVLSTVVFFLITNFAAWADPIHGFYSKDLPGLLQCYAMGLAFTKGNFLSSFFFNSLISNVGFSVLVFSLYSAYQRAVSPSQEAVL